MATKKSFRKSFTQPDERRDFQGHGHVDVLNFEGGPVFGRGVFEPGWRWSNDVKPIAGTSTCEASHTGYCLSGTMVIRMDNGEEIKIRPGDAFHIEPGHDAWTEGDETCIMVDVTGFGEYAKRKAA